MVIHAAVTSITEKPGGFALRPNHVADSAANVITVWPEVWIFATCQKRHHAHARDAWPNVAFIPATFGALMTSQPIQSPIVDQLHVKWNVCTKPYLRVLSGARLKEKSVAAKLARRYLQFLMTAGRSDVGWTFLSVGFPKHVVAAQVPATRELLAIGSPAGQDSDKNVPATGIAI